MFNLREGKWYPLTERLSRWARIQLLRVLIEERDRKKVAEACGVTVQAVSNWIHRRNNHPSDETSNTLLRLALSEVPRKAEGIIQKDIKRYFEELEGIGLKILEINGTLTVRKD